MTPITSLQNARVKAAIKLRDRRGRDKQQRIVIDGRREIGHALAGGVELTEVFTCDALIDSSIARDLLLQIEQAGVEPAYAVHVGDMYLEDILGAKNIGIRPFLIDRGRKSLFPSFPEAADHSPVEVEIVRGLEPMLDTLGVE